MPLSEFRTLPDYLRPGLRVVSVGLNPSLPSVEKGYYFANPRNRFWAALHRSGLADRALQPGAAAMQRLLEQYGIGFTDVAKRPSRMGHELRAADFRRDAPRLREKLLAHAPRWVWFHGKVAYRYYRQYADNTRPAAVDWGEQPDRIGDSRVFVTPNPSPANAAYSLDVLAQWYRRLYERLHHGSGQ